MKKNLLVLASLAAAFAASAQVEAIWFDKEISGAFAETGKVSIEAGTVIGRGEAGELKLAYTDDWGVGGIDDHGYNSLKVNGVEVGRVPSGAVGNSNPQGWSTSTAATSGAVFQFDAKKDGFLVIPSKYSTNKNYWVFEGLAGEGEMCVAYTFGIEGAGFGQRIDYTLPADKDGYLDVNAADIDKYVNGTSIKWPEKVVLGDAAADVKSHGYGVIIFPVYEGCKYLFGAQGSKMTCSGVVFADKAPEVTIYGPAGEDGTTPKEETFSFGAQGGDSSAIESTVIDQPVDENAPIYNVYGQRVNREYKGILIQNGKKFINF